MGLHPRKKSRIERDGSTLNTESTHCERPLYFDIVPQEIHDHVLRFFSYLPRAEEWEEHISVSDIVPLYCVKGDLGKFMNSRFRTLCISKTVDCEYENGYYNWKLKNGSMLWIDEMRDAHDFILKVGGKSLVTIIVGEEGYGEDRYCSVMVRDFQRACPNVRSLRVVEENSEWVSQFGTQLENLEVASGNPISAIPNECPSLRELNFSSREEDTFQFPAFDIVDIDWDNIGGSLECLAISSFKPSTHGFETMRKRCKNLKNIVLRSSEPGTKQIAEFLASYGSQLEFAYIYDVEEGELKNLASSCRNAVFHIDVFMNHLLIPCLTILASQLQNVRVVFEGYQFDSIQLADAWNLCVNLEELSVADFDGKHIRAIMATPKDNLKLIRLSGTEVYVDMEEIMNVIADGTKHVETFQYFGLQISPGAVENFIDKNKSSLRYVSIINRVTLSISDVDEMIEKFMECPLLQEICFRELPGARVLKTLQNNGVHFRFYSVV